MTITVFLPGSSRQQRQLEIEGNQGVGVELPGNELKVKMKGLELSPRGRQDEVGAGGLNWEGRLWKG